MTLSLCGLRGVVTSRWQGTGGSKTFTLQLVRGQSELFRICYMVIFQGRFSSHFNHKKEVLEATEKTVEVKYLFLWFYPVFLHFLETLLHFCSTDHAMMAVSLWLYMQMF